MYLIDLRAANQILIFQINFSKNLARVLNPRSLASKIRYPRGLRKTLKFPASPPAPPLSSKNLGLIRPEALSTRQISAQRISGLRRKSLWHIPLAISEFLHKTGACEQGFVDRLGVVIAKLRSVGLRKNSVLCRQSTAPGTESRKTVFWGQNVTPGCVPCAERRYEDVGVFEDRIFHESGVDGAVRG
jgi:hypothetical protein